MAQDEQATVAALDAARSVFRSTIEAHDGRVIDTAGDSVLAVFETAAGAVTSAIAVQQALETQVAGVPADRRMRFRIGVHMGDVIEKADGTVYGDGVNIAARLESLAQPGGITVSDAIHGAVRNRIAAVFEDLGEQLVKNIADPVHAYAVRSHAGGEGVAGQSTFQSGARGKIWRVLTWPRVAAALLVTALAGGVAGYLRMDRGSRDAGQGQPMSASILPFKMAPGGRVDDEQFASEFHRMLLAALGRRLYGWNLVSGDATSASGRATDDSKSPVPVQTARYRVAGEMKRAAGKATIDVQITQFHTGTQVWAGRVELDDARLGQMPDLFLNRTTNSVATALGRAEIQRVIKLPLSELGAMELVYRAHGVVTSRSFVSPGEIKEMLELCEAALRIDPNLVPAMVCKAFALWLPLDLIGATIDSQVLAELDDLSARAVSAEPNYSGAWRVRAVALQVLKKADAALEASEREIRADPTRSFGLFNRAFFMIWSGQPDEAFPLTAKLLELDPTEIGYAELANCEAYVLLGQFDKAITSCERSSSEDPHWMVHIALAAAYAQQGDLAKAAAARDKAVSRQPKLTLATFKASRKIKADSPKQWEQYEKYWEPGLRKAGLREQ